MNALWNGFCLLGSINQRIGRLGVAAGAGMIAAMTLIVIAGVVFRYVLNDSLTWAEDVSLILMVTTAFLVAPHAYRSGANVAIEMISGMLDGRAARLLRILINLLVLWLIYRYFAESIALVRRGWGIRVNTVPIAWAWPYMIVPAAFVAMALVGIELVARDCWAVVTGRSDADLPVLAPVEPE